MLKDLKETYIEAPYWIDARGDPQDQELLTSKIFLDCIKSCFDSITVYDFLSQDIDDACFRKLEDVLLREYHFLDFNVLCNAEKQLMQLYNLYVV